MKIKADKNPDNRDWIKQVRQRSAEEFLTKHMGPGPHPSGSPQDVHGRVRVLAPDERLTGLENTMADLPDHVTEKIRAKALDQLGTDEEILERFRELMRDAATHGNAQFWYEERHQWAEEQTDGTKFSADQFLGMTAAISSGMLWEKNESIAEMMLTVHIFDDPLSEQLDLPLVQAKLDAYAAKYPDKITESQTIDETTRLSDIENPYLAAIAFGEITKVRGDSYPARYGYETLSQGIRIMRGESFDSVVNGVKRRSFYNNMLALDGDNDVTIDVQMLGAARWENIGAQGSLEGNLISSPSYLGADLGVRPLIADLVRQITDEYNAMTNNPYGRLLPRQTQAIIWVEFKEQLGRFGEER